MEKLTPQQAHTELIKAQITGSFSNVEDCLEKSSINVLDPLCKGSVSNNFDNYGSSIRFLKTGKEIKEKLQLLLIEHKTQFTLMKDKLSGLITAIGREPAASENTYGYYQDVDNIDFLPIKYASNLCYENDCEIQVDSVLNISPKSDENKVAEVNLYRQYNDLADKIVDCQTEQKLIEIMLNNFDDNQEYPLTIKQGAVLNF